MTDAHLPEYTRFIVKTSLLHPVTKEVSPPGGVDIISTQKTNSDIQLMLKMFSGETTLTHPVNLMSTFFQKLHKNRKRLENVNGVPYRIFKDHTGLESQKQIVVPDQVMLEKIWSLHSNPVQGHPGSKRCYMNYANATTLQVMLKKHKKYSKAVKLACDRNRRTNQRSVHRCRRNTTRVTALLI